MKRILSTLALLSLCILSGAQEDPDNTVRKTWWERLRDNNFESEVQKDTAEPKNADIKDTLSVAVILPFNSTGTPDNISYSLYSGVLCAMREFGNQGIPIKLNVFDTSLGVDTEAIAENDILLGPISRKDIKEIAPQLPEGKFLISPLEPSVTGLTDSLRIIQAPLPWSNQIAQMTKWACDEMLPSDSLVVIKEKSLESEAYMAVRNKINETGRSCIIVGCETYEDIYAILSRYISKNGTTRFILASENGEFAKRVLEVIATLKNEQHSVATYCPAKLRNIKGITKTILCYADSRIAVGYYSDQSSLDANEFYAIYKKYFKVKPSQFSIQGYDLAKYFVTLYQLYPKDWERHIEDFDKAGVQATFDFTRPQGVAGFVNQGVRHLLYSGSSVIYSR